MMPSLRAALPAYDVVTAFEMAWGTLTNGKLLAAAEEAGFSVMITGDRNIRFQQDLAGRRLALVVLSTNLWPTLLGNLTMIVTAVDQATAGSYTSIAFDRPVLRRRPFHPKPEC